MESEGEDTKNVLITLITEKSEINNVFVTEMSCSAVIDTACSKQLLRQIGLQIIQKTLMIIR